ncbi:MAG: DEAD/DEAH box helicase family protein [Methanimicrococcus sp.]|nr:DEAD/DEAH box helicase family protein [Methanimicrococcus sp.]
MSKMKLQFDADLGYQQQAISSVVDLFKGQLPKQTFFMVPYYEGQSRFDELGFGVGNRLELDEEDILKNLRHIQLANRLPQSQSLEKPLNFTVEMETGTGKTYVYIRSVLELNKKYGFSKFIVVVPNIAIKEGVYKSFEITKEHFKSLYDNTIYDFFIYDSSKLEQIRSYAASDNISIMIINIDAFRKSFDDPEKENKSNLIHRVNEKLDGFKPIEIIQETNPIVIIDEPQSVDTTEKSKEAIKSLNPMCIFRYSATHVEKHHMVYKLDAVDSYNEKLVKQIEVAGLETSDQHNTAYIRLISVDNKKSPIKAKVEIDVDSKGKVSRKTITVKQGDDLFEKSGNRDVYEGYMIREIYCGDPGYISFTGKTDIIEVGQVIGDADTLALKELQIRKTIEEHLDKEVILNKKGIKVLSLFFIDRVAKYREYDGEGNRQKGIYAELFEKNYLDLIRLPKYKELKCLEDDVDSVHNGYFSTDKGKDKQNEKIFKDTSGSTIADEDTYNLIMKDKEKLLSFDSKLRFIFSHSALREGWDNPNVFQICTLNETSSEIKKRQEIGRGLRLCVNQDGERQFGFEINTLTVMANESYEEFAEKLQKEYEEDSGIRFGFIEPHIFADIMLENVGREEHAPYIGDSISEDMVLGQGKSETLYQFMVEKKYIDSKGKIQSDLKEALNKNSFELPHEFEEYRPEIESRCIKASQNLNIKNNAKKERIKLNKAVYLSEDFKDLWDRIKYKTTYSVNFDSEKLIEKCCKNLKNLKIPAIKIVYSKSKYDIESSGIKTTEVDRRTEEVAEFSGNLPDVISYLQNTTNLTRKTIAEILIQSDQLVLFKRNPQKFMEEVSRIIKSTMQSMIVDGIKYTRIGDQEYYAQELFETEELTGYLEQNMIQSKRSVYDHTIYQSAVEKRFAESLENYVNVELYVKLPGWFKINTPLHAYNPDWAVLINDQGSKKLYFVLETKGNIEFEQLRPSESSKIEYGRKHFEAINTETGANVRFKPIEDIKELWEES